ncbi:DUF4394 domain-containing protein [Sporichthya polymorpha]|uniref:DUF4394 domain-containing protein n=1 Tax=Sporichthya polymorpha TaxID=35751 RepID=UPI000372F6DF|nr:DUF4394 domain-containing protein [Sporichthya polymorpha]
MKALIAALAAGAAVSTLTLTAMPSASAAPTGPTKACGADRSAGLEAVAIAASGTLLCLDVRNPGDARAIGKVTGLDSGSRLIGIDYRPENGKLYGVGTNGGLYTIHTGTAKATKVATMSITPSGATFGVDFNPVVDRLRIVSDTGQNLRVDVATGATTADTDLTNPVPAPGTGTQGARGVTGAAYTNNDKLARTDTATTLFDIDTVLDRVALQSPANAGTLAPTGRLGIDVAAENGFDVYSYLSKGVATRNVAFAALRTGSRTALYRVDLLDGSVVSLGRFAAKRGEIIGLALPLNQR